MQSTAPEQLGENSKGVFGKVFSAVDSAIRGTVETKSLSQENAHHSYRHKAHKGKRKAQDRAHAKKAEEEFLLKLSQQEVASKQQKEAKSQSHSKRSSLVREEVQ